MTTIFFTRHGETEWNVQRRMQGWQDSLLTEHGRLQATRLGERIAIAPLVAIYPNIAPRVITTAELVRSDRSIPIIPLEGFREMGLGIWEGHSISELFEEESINFQNFLNHLDKFIPPKGAEGFEEVK
jgi:probable phosphoglycerate mutase